MLAENSVSVSVCVCVCVCVQVAGAVSKKLLRGYIEIGGIPMYVQEEARILN